MVLRQSTPPLTELPKDSKVTIYVSREPTTARVPDVVGRSESNATNQLLRAGFDPNVIRVDVTDQSQDGLVIEQSPRAGTRIKKGQRVTVSVGHFTAPAATTPSPSPSP
jgi:serine/threonine-protein kinase